MNPKCLYCGCKDNSPCVNKTTGEYCHWIVIFFPLPVGEGQGEGGAEASAICSRCADTLDLRISIAVGTVDDIIAITTLRDRK